MKYIPLLFTLIIISLAFSPVYGDDLDELSDLGGDDLSTLSESGETTDSENTISDSDTGSAEPSITFGGYLKPLIYGSSTTFSDETWQILEMYRAQGKDVPEEQKEDKFTDVGARIQLKMEGFLGDAARLYTAVNIDYNEVSTTGTPTTTTRVVESYIELFEGSRTWKIGNQLITWGFMEGSEVPTDRINARDYSYTSSEYEDIKLGSTGIYLSQSLGDFSSLDLFYAPVSQRNVDPEFIGYMVNDAQSAPEYTANQSKMAARVLMTLGNLDFALSHVQGLDTEFDLVTDASNDSYKYYNPVQSTGLDFQYNFGSFLAKLAYVNYLTEDKEGDDAYIKNDWDKYLFGVEFVAGGATVNIYAGQKRIMDFEKTSPLTNLLLGQTTETMDFISGHIRGSFLAGDALTTTVLFAAYQDDDGETVQSLVMPSVTYKIADGLETTFAADYINRVDNTFNRVKTELKYSF